MKQFSVFVLLATSLLFAQHKIPFASKSNTIELTITNTSTIEASNVEVIIVHKPEWMQIENSKYKIENVKVKESAQARFTFAVDKSALVGKAETVTFNITNAAGESWTKTLSIQVSPPEKFELFQNFPNPFNPATTISYQLPAASDVSIKIYDITGREVTTLFNGMSEAGYHQFEWNATNAASGTYIYQLVTTNLEEKSEFHRKKMMLLK
jgi:hypothetical protein